MQTINRKKRFIITIDSVLQAMEGIIESVVLTVDNEIFFHVGHVADDAFVLGLPKVDHGIPNLFLERFSCTKLIEVPPQHFNKRLDAIQFVQRFYVYQDEAEISRLILTNQIAPLSIYGDLVQPPDE